MKWWMVAISISPVGDGSGFALAAPNRTFYFLAKSRLRDVAARSLSSLDLTTDMMVASCAYKMDCFFRSCEMLSMKMINRRGPSMEP